MSFRNLYAWTSVGCCTAGWIFTEYNHPFWAMFSIISAIWFVRQAFVYWFIGE